MRLGAVIAARRGLSARKPRGAWPRDKGKCLHSTLRGDVNKADPPRTLARAGTAPPPRPGPSWVPPARPALTGCARCCPQTSFPSARDPRRRPSRPTRSPRDAPRLAALQPSAPRSKPRASGCDEVRAAAGPRGEGPPRGVPSVAVSSDSPHFSPAASRPKSPEGARWAADRRGALGLGWDRPCSSNRRQLPQSSVRFCV